MLRILTEMAGRWSPARRAASTQKLSSWPCSSAKARGRCGLYIVRPRTVVLDRTPTERGHAVRTLPLMVMVSARWGLGLGLLFCVLCSCSCSSCSVLPSRHSSVVVLWLWWVGYKWFSVSAACVLGIYTSACPHNKQAGHRTSLSLTPHSGRG